MWERGYRTFDDIAEFIGVVGVGSPDDEFGDVLRPKCRQDDARVTAVTPAQHVVPLIAQGLATRTQGQS